MAEYWKSTPSYWCKFCEQYVRDTAIERKNHESTAKHQNNIQRQLRDLHKNQERQQREKQRAKDEVARLNGLVGGKGSSTAGSSPAAFSRPGARAPAPEPPKLSAAAQRKARAEQLIALGVTLPEELKREVTGVGGWQVTAEKVVEPGKAEGRTLADIKREEDECKAGFTAAEGMSKGVHKRKAEDDEDVRDEEAAPKKKVWGSSFKKYPGANRDEDEEEDLDALLSGVGKKKSQKKGEPESNGAVSTSDVKAESGPQVKSEPAQPDSGPAAEGVKIEENEFAVTAPPTVVFKKRKGTKK